MTVIARIEFETTIIEIVKINKFIIKSTTVAIVAIVQRN